MAALGNRAQRHDVHAGDAARKVADLHAAVGGFLLQLAAELLAHQLREQPAHRRVRVVFHAGIVALRGDFRAEGRAHRLDLLAELIAVFGVGAADHALRRHPPVRNAQRAHVVAQRHHAGALRLHVAHAVGQRRDQPQALRIVALRAVVGDLLHGHGQAGIGGMKQLAEALVQPGKAGRRVQHVFRRNAHRRPCVPGDGVGGLAAARIDQRRAGGFQLHHHMAQQLHGVGATPMDLARRMAAVQPADADAEGLARRFHRLHGHGQVDAPSAAGGHRGHGLATAVHGDHPPRAHQRRVELRRADQADLLLHGEQALQRRMLHIVRKQQLQHVRHAVAVVRAQRRAVGAEPAVLIRHQPDGIGREIVLTAGDFGADHVHMGLQKQRRAVFPARGCGLAHQHVAQRILHGLQTAGAGAVTDGVAQSALVAGTVGKLAQPRELLFHAGGRNKGLQVHDHQHSRLI